VGVADSVDGPVSRRSYCDWFDFDKVHPLERKALPEFFDGRVADDGEEVRDALERSQWCRGD
jgi:hypothetical protein